MWVLVLKQDHTEPSVKMSTARTSYGILDDFGFSSNRFELVKL